MQVQDVMSRDSICCDRESHLGDVARLMRDENPLGHRALDCMSEPRVDS